MCLELFTRDVSNYSGLVGAVVRSPGDVTGQTTGCAMPPFERILNMKRFLELLCVVAICLSLSACGKTKPKGFPEKLVPVTVKVVNGDQPVEGVRVVCFGKIDQSLVCGGLTDTSGIATLLTDLGGYSESGVPAGEYKLTLNKEVTVEDSWTADDYVKKSMGEKNKHGRELQAARDKLPKIVPQKYTLVGSTPLSVNAASDPVTLDVDISK